MHEVNRTIPTCSSLQLRILIRAFLKIEKKYKGWTRYGNWLTIYLKKITFCCNILLQAAPQTETHFLDLRTLPNLTELPLFGGDQEVLSLLLYKVLLVSYNCNSTQKVYGVTIRAVVYRTSHNTQASLVVTKMEQFSTTQATHIQKRVS